MVELTSDPGGTILHLQRLSTEDGPGIRTTVFFKGCPLRCLWCHNPESLQLRPQVQWLENRCIGCDSCLAACHQNGLSRGQAGILRDLSRCTACGECAEACPSGAMEVLGKRVSAAELCKELVKDREYFEKSGGGVTLSGGEPTLQPAFALSLCSELRQAGIRIALDTCGLCSSQTLDQLLSMVDMVLFDVKWIDPTEHAAWTGVTNSAILENLVRVKNYIRCENPSMVLWIRTPLIPGATATRKNIQAIGTFLHEKIDGSVVRWELCAFNNLCRDKYRRLGMNWQFANSPLMTRAELDNCLEWAHGSGFNPQITFVTGAARVAV